MSFTKSIEIEHTKRVVRACQCVIKARHRVLKTHLEHGRFSSVRLAPVHMILLAEISRLVGRIIPCIHIRHFIPFAEMSSKFFLLAPAKRVHFNHAA